MRKKLAALWGAMGQEVELIKSAIDPSIPNKAVIVLVYEFGKDEAFKQGTRLDGQRYRFRFLEDEALQEADVIHYLGKYYKVIDYRQTVSFQEAYWEAEAEEVIQTKKGSFYDD